MDQLCLPKRGTYTFAADTPCLQFEKNEVSFKTESPLPVEFIAKRYAKLMKYFKKILTWKI